MAKDSYIIKYKDYDAIANEYITKVILGDAKKFADLDRIENILLEASATVYKTEYISQYNTYVVYDRKPAVIDNYDVAYSLTFNSEANMKYFYYLLDSLYSDLNMYEPLYNAEVLIEAGSAEDR